MDTIIMDRGNIIITLRDVPTSIKPIVTVDWGSGKAVFSGYLVVFDIDKNEVIFNTTDTPYPITITIKGGKIELIDKTE